jgi:hypothetical protein
LTRWLLAAGGLAVLAVALMGADAGREDFQRIYHGMTYDDVVAIIGQGRLKSRSHGVTTYEWRTRRDGDGRYTLIQLRFRDGRVVDKARAAVRVRETSE